MCKKFDFGSLSVLAVVGGPALLAFEFGPPVVPPACRLHPTKLSLIPVKNPSGDAYSKEFGPANV